MYAAMLMMSCKDVIHE